MKLNHEYVKKILLAIEREPTARPCLGKVLGNLGLNDVSQEFVLHYEVLLDSMLIATVLQNELITQDTMGVYYWRDDPIRLTAKGHEFIEAINQAKIWEIIKKEFKESSVKTIFKVATELAEGYAKKKVEKLLGE